MVWNAKHFKLKMLQDVMKSFFVLVHSVRVLARMGEFEGERRERLSSLRYGKAGPFCREQRPNGRPQEPYGHRQQSKGVPSPSSRAFALERFNFEKGETRGGGTAPPGQK